MNKTNYDALLISIEHWKRFAAGTAYPAERIYSDNCALCQLFNNSCKPETSLLCLGCIIEERTGQPGCRSTPFLEINSHYIGLHIKDENYNFEADTTRDKQKRIKGEPAQKMVDFLEGIAKEGIDEGE